jgi:hypothetical protein
MVTQRGHESISDGNAAVRVLFHRSERHLLRLRRAADTLRPRESPEPPAHQVQIGQRTGDQQPVCILRQAPVAGLHEAEDALDDEEGMLDLGAHAGLGLVLRPLFLIDRILVAVATVGEVFRLRSMRSNDVALPLIGRITPQAGLLPVQEDGQAHGVMHIGGRGGHRMDELALAGDGARASRVQAER